MNNKIISLLRLCRKAIAGDTRHLLLKTSALTETCLWAGVILAQQPLAGGADLFASWLLAGKEIDAERALPITSFYATEGLKTPAEPGTLVCAELATDFALPPGITATRILYHTRTASNKDTFASGVVLVPYGQPPKDGWPLLARSHGQAASPGIVRPLS